ncbi:MAG TPA: hypothetical protein V6C91_14285 [Coleofasciculaceae cyanobacterium]|nr:hypothetical protein [Cyanobacteria bacterium UBA8543]
MTDDSKKFRKVNANLGQQPNIGPFPADQFLPWIAIVGTSYYLCKVLLQFNWVATGCVAAWGIATWWVLTGSKSWRFLSKFIGTPYLVRGYGRYRPFVKSDSQRQKNS